jgi:hypothetical protein
VDVITLGRTAQATLVPLVGEICCRATGNIHLNVFGPSL